MKMTWLHLFGLVLFLAHVYGRFQLIATRSLPCTIGLWSTEDVDTIMELKAEELKLILAPSNSARKIWAQTFRHMYILSLKTSWVGDISAPWRSRHRNVTALWIFQHHGHSGRSQCHNIPIHGAIIFMCPKHLSCKMPPCQNAMVPKYPLFQNFPLSM